jgi:protein-arginine kinase activator protein McsA
VHDYKIKEAVTKIVADNMELIEKDSLLLQIFDTPLWTRVLELKCSCTDSSPHLSILIAEYCRIHESLDADTFLTLTSAGLLPEIDFRAAKDLITAENRIVGNTSSTNVGELSDLQERCIEALSKSWTKLEVKQADIIDFLQKQSPLLLTKLLTKSVLGAQEAYSKLEEKHSNIATLHTQLQSSHSHKIEAIEISKSALQRTIHTLRVTEMQLVEDYLEAASQRDQYAQEISRFVPLGRRSGHKIDSQIPSGFPKFGASTLCNMTNQKVPTMLRDSKHCPVYSFQPY